MFSNTSFRCNFTIVNKSCLKSYFAKVCNIKSSQNGYNPNRHISSVSVNLGLILKGTQYYQHPGDFLYKNNYGLLSNLKASFIRFHTSTYIRVTKEGFENVPSKQLPVLKRSQRRKRQTLDESDKPSLELKTVMAYATAEEYDLERLKAGLIKQDLYKPVHLCSGDELKHTDVPDMLYAVASYQVDVQPREIFFFREGSVVFWNVTELECGTVLNFL